MQHFELKGTTRQVGNKAVIKAFRREGLVPCNLYGADIKENILFTVNAKELKALTDTPKAFIVDLVLDGAKKARTAVLHELQWHPVTDECLHVDFLAVDDKTPITISVPLVIEGHAKGVQQGGKFYQNTRILRISALMKNLPDEIPVDITDLGLDKRIKASDIQIKNVSVVSDKDTIICGVKTTRNVTAAATEE
ncbi:MAG: 50S ribosomal protein L25 [Bacteroidales bacterium]|jgi:large subunit ribosomal protein L25|nr:50S ribosomal protein L25 [Bacteroidales bacterium]